MFLLALVSYYCQQLRIITIIAYYFGLNIWERAKVYINDVICTIRIGVNIQLLWLLQGLSSYRAHTSWWRGKQDGFNALDNREIKHGDAGRSGNYPVLSVLTDNAARFLYEFLDSRFSGLSSPFTSRQKRLWCAWTHQKWSGMDTSACIKYYAVEKWYQVYGFIVFWQLFILIVS